MINELKFKRYIVLHEWINFIAEHKKEHKKNKNL